MHPAPRPGSILVRILRLACPACGRGPLFRRYFVRADRCSHCRWKFERGAGHWVGGSEVHMFAAYGISVLICIPVLILAGRSPFVLGAVIAAHVVLSLAVFRYSRALFLGLDYLFDPARPPGGGGGGSREATRPCPPAPRARPRARRGGARLRGAPPVRPVRYMLSKGGDGRGGVLGPRT
ncbi:MAG: hypothetical protein ACYS0K_00595 [Planctomycetota bacterium]